MNLLNNFYMKTMLTIYQMFTAKCQALYIKGVDFKVLQLVLCIPSMLQHLSLILSPTYNRWEDSTLFPQHYTKEVEDE